MATAAKLGKGTLFKVGNGASPEVFSTLEETLEVGFPNSQRDLVDVTNNDTSGTNKEYILGLGDGEEMQVKCNYTNTTLQNSLLADKDAGTLRNFQVVVPTASAKTASFAGLVRAWKLDPPIAAQMTLTVTIKLSGAVSLT